VSPGVAVCIQIAPRGEKLLDDAVPVLLLVVIRAWVPVIHVISHDIMKQDSNLARRCGHGLGVADASGKTPVKSAECCIASANRYRRKFECDGDSVAGLSCSSYSVRARQELIGMLVANAICALVLLGGIAAQTGGAKIFPGILLITF
jgi:hypothetical protein